MATASKRAKPIPRAPDPDEERHNAPPLEERERIKADEEEELNVSVTYEVIRRAGRDELRRPSSALAWSGLAGGLSMGFSMLTEALLESHLPAAPWTPLIATLGYPVGFLIVVLGNQQLFTENTLTAVIPLLANRSRAALFNTLRLWGLVLVANLAGAFLFAIALQMDGLFAPEVVRAFERIAGVALAGGPAHNFALAIFAGWLIAVMVWMLPGAGDMRIVVILVTTWLVGIGGFPHVIAGSITAFYGALHGQAAWSVVFGSYVLPALAGNTIGGFALVSGLSHAQVVAGGGRRDS